MQIKKMGKEEFMFNQEEIKRNPITKQKGVKVSCKKIKHIWIELQKLLNETQE